MSTVPFTYEPDELFDLGDIGEHPILFTTWIETEPDRRPIVKFMRAIVDLICKGESVGKLDVTRFIMQSPVARERWESEILSAYAKAKEKLERDYDEGA